MFTLPGPRILIRRRLAHHPSGQSEGLLHPGSRARVKGGDLQKVKAAKTSGGEEYIKLIC